MLEKVISGGQIGADMAALEAAYELGIPTGGVAPYGYTNIKGVNMELKTKYGLEENGIGGTVAMQYARRSMLNVDAADATIAFQTESSTGTDRSVNYCRTGTWSEKVGCGMKHSPVHVISNLDPTNEKTMRDALDFLKQHNVKILNVCGSRNSKKFKDWHNRVKNFLLVLLPKYYPNARKLHQDTRKQSSIEAFARKPTHGTVQVSLRQMGSWTGGKKQDSGSEIKGSPKQEEEQNLQEKVA